MDPSLIESHTGMKVLPREEFDLLFAQLESSRSNIRDVDAQVQEAFSKVLNVNMELTNTKEGIEELKKLIESKRGEEADKKKDEDVTADLVEEDKNVEVVAASNNANIVQIWIPKQPDPMPTLKILKAMAPANIAGTDEDIFIQHNCSATSQVRLQLLSEEDGNTKWMMQTLDQNGSEKHVGGDEFYITYHPDSYHLS